MLHVPNNIKHIPKIVIDHQIVTYIFKIAHLSEKVRVIPGKNCKYIFLSLIKKNILSSGCDEVLAAALIGYLIIKYIPEIQFICMINKHY